MGMKITPGGKHIKHHVTLRITLKNPAWKSKIPRKKSSDEHYDWLRYATRKNTRPHTN